MNHPHQENVGFQFHLGPDYWNCNDWFTQATLSQASTISKSKSSKPPTTAPCSVPSQVFLWNIFPPFSASSSTCPAPAPFPSFQYVFITLKSRNKKCFPWLAAPGSYNCISFSPVTAKLLKVIYIPSPPFSHLPWLPEALAVWLPSQCFTETTHSRVNDVLVSKSNGFDLVVILPGVKDHASLRMIALMIIQKLLYFKIGQVLKDHL